MIEPSFQKIDWKKEPKQSMEDTLESKPMFIKLYRHNILVRLGLIFCLLFFATFLIGDFTERNDIALSNVAYGESSVNVPVTGEMVKEELIITDAPPKIEPPIFLDSNESSSANSDTNEEFTVQAVLGAKRQIVLASGLDSKITKFSIESGDRFKKGDVLIQYDCAVDQARLSEAMSRQRVTEQQLIAYQKLSSLDSVADIELMVARENNEQNKALISQIQGRLKSCKHIAPWDGRVMRKMASQYEYVQRGRVLMEIASHDPLRAEFLIPSTWLRWLNLDTPVSIYIRETDRTYTAKIINVFGEVDPVSQSVQVVAEIEKYHEELLPGMSGRATFTQNTIEKGNSKGFLGLKLSENRTK